MKSIHLIIKGNVQGVGYRYSVKSKANSLKLKGSVQNLENGSVEIYCLGSIKNIKEFIEYCKNNPGWSKVDEVIVEDIKDKYLIEKLGFMEEFGIV